MRTLSPQAGTDGIRGVNYGTGTITITAEAGASISAGRYGIAAIGKQGDITITNYAAVNGGSAAINATTEAGGTVTIDNFGTLVGKIISSNVTFHNELGALWNVTGSTPFAATDTLINDGTINLQSGTLNIATSVTGAGIIHDCQRIHAGVWKFGYSRDDRFVYGGQRNVAA